MVNVTSSLKDAYLEQLLEVGHLLDDLTVEDMGEWSTEFWAKRSKLLDEIDYLMKYLSISYNEMLIITGHVRPHEGHDIPF